MQFFDNNGERWPPAGWARLGSIEKRSDQVIVKDIRSARVYGLAYTILSEPLYAIQERYSRHYLRIDGWEYTLRNDASEYPILQMTFTDRYDLKRPEESFVSEIRSLSCPVPVHEGTVKRAVMLSRFLITQINAGQVPDVDNILRIYHLHPLQDIGESACEEKQIVAKAKNILSGKTKDKTRNSW